MDNLLALVSIVTSNILISYPKTTC